MLLLGYFKNQKIQNCLAPNLRQVGYPLSFFIYKNIKFSLERNEKKLTMKGKLNYEFKQYKSQFKQFNTIGS